MKAVSEDKMPRRRQSTRVRTIAKKAEIVEKQRLYELTKAVRVCVGVCACVYTTDPSTHACARARVRTYSCTRV